MNAVFESDYYPFGMLTADRTTRLAYDLSLDLVAVDMNEDPANISSELHGYRFGFNGQEKVDEISGAGNHNTAMFWEYDTRLGRRWNLDPKPDPSISSYSAFVNNPIFYSDVNGDTIGVNFHSIRTFGESLWQDIKNLVTSKGVMSYTVGETYVKDKTNDGYFAVFAHGGPPPVRSLKRSQ